jgi:catechol 2,3-dioxygenase-like lactoylglutathione lyase family enzyme
VTAPSELEEGVLDWYSKTLGLQQLDKPEGTRGAGGWFRAGQVEVHVTIEQAAQPEGHFGVVVDDFDGAVAHLRRDGCVIEPARPIRGRNRCYTRDPAGNRVEIVFYDKGASA